MWAGEMTEEQLKRWSNRWYKQKLELLESETRRIADSQNEFPAWKTLGEQDRRRILIFFVHECSLILRVFVNGNAEFVPGDYIGRMSHVVADPNLQSKFPLGTKRLVMRQDQQKARHDKPSLEIQARRETTLGHLFPNQRIVGEDAFLVGFFGHKAMGYVDPNQKTRIWKYAGEIPIESIQEPPKLEPLDIYFGFQRYALHLIGTIYEWPYSF